MNFAADELLSELERIDATLAEAVGRAGQGCDPEFERRLDGHVRSLRTMLGTDDLAVAVDTMEAARRVMDAAAPDAPRLLLAMAGDTLAAVLRRQANSQRLRAVA